MTDILSGREVDAPGDAESIGVDEDESAKEIMASIGDEWILPDGRYIHSSHFDIVFRLRKVQEFFELRDRMNAAIHLGEVRWSPITIEVENLVDELTDCFAYEREEEDNAEAE